jgi:serine/threonine protein kinase
LQYLHRHGLVHGDIKPSNIGFDGQGIPKLLDFGLSRPYSEPDGASAITPLIPFGTPFYTCPEARGAETPRPEFDLWSLALVLYETLAGETFSKVRRQQSCVPPLSNFREDVPKTMDEFFVRALNLCPDRRPRSASEFALWLRRARPI